MPNARGAEETEIKVTQVMGSAGLNQHDVCRSDAVFTVGGSGLGGVKAARLLDTAGALEAVGDQNLVVRFSGLPTRDAGGGQVGLGLLDAAGKPVQSTPVMLTATCPPGSARATSAGR